jgi:hypothetical protein
MISTPFPAETATLDAAIRRARDGVRPFAIAEIRSARTAAELANVTRKLGAVLIDADLAGEIAARHNELLDVSAGARWRAEQGAHTQAANHP